MLKLTIFMLILAMFAFIAMIIIMMKIEFKEQKLVFNSIKFMEENGND